MNFQRGNGNILRGVFGIFARSARFINYILLPLLIISFAVAGYAGEAPRKKIPFQPGEKLAYRGTWGKLDAGELTMEVLPITRIGSVEAYHFLMITKTSPRVDVIYKVRERQESYVDTGITRSLLYRKNNISKHPRNVIVDFDWKNRQATYSNFGKKANPVRISQGAFDPLALFYVIRAQNLQQNSKIYIPITDGKQNIEVTATIGKRSRVKIAGKTYNAIAITPDMKMFDNLNNLTKNNESSQMKIWVTDDEKKIPIKIRSRVGVISFDFEFIPGLSSIR